MVSINYERVGVDLGSKWIKLSLLGQTPDNHFVEHTAHYEAVGTFGDKRYFKSLKQNIKDFAEDCALTKLSLAFTIAPRLDGFTTLDALTLPTTDSKILKKAVKFEMSQQGIVDNMAESHHLWTIVDGQPVEEGIEEEQTRIVLATLKKSILFELAELRGLKWKIESIEVQGNTASRFIKGHAAVIDMGHHSTRLYLYKNGELLSFDTVEHSGAQLTQAIQEKLNIVSKENAEAIKHQTVIENKFLKQSFPDENVRIASEITTEEYTFAISEIKRIIRTFEIKEFVTLNQVYFTGGGTLLTDFKAFLSEELGHDAEPLHESVHSTTEGTETEKPAEVVQAAPEPLIEDEFTDFLNANAVDEEVNNEEDESESLIGLEEVRAELTDQEDAQPPVQTRSDRYSSIEPDVPELHDLSCSVALFDEVESLPELDFSRFLKFTFNYMPFFVAVMAFALALYGGVYAVNNQYDARIDQVISQTSAQQQTLNDLQSQAHMLESERSDHERVVAVIDGLQGIKVWYSDLLYAIPDITPSGVVVQQINIQDGTLQIDGYATDYSNVAVFAMGLEGYGEVDITEIEEHDDSTLYTADLADSDTVHNYDAMTKTYSISIDKE